MNSIEKLISARSPDKNLVCEKHGDFVSRNHFRDIWSQCPKCMADLREEEKRQQREDHAKAMQEARKSDWQERLGRAAIPERFKDRTLQSYVAESQQQKVALEFALDYADNFDKVMKTGRSAIFVGKPGTGKTHLAVGIALRAMGRHGADALFMTVRHVLLAVKDTFRKDSERSEWDVIQDFVRTDLLILDEVGVQGGSDFEKFTLFDILNARYERRRPTIFLSNLPADEVALFLGERVMDRLREDSGAVIPFTWESHRGREPE